ncbi:hypothetical protein GGR51DRAFT_270179 [Nemania sp. FL0031]|nr:hypothetical protein GGR51DRAFT_270179 [Nemania sp. FL0031]
MHGTFETTTVGWLTIILGWILTTLALVSVILYIWSRGHLKVSVDDILLYLSFLISLVLMSVTTWAVVVQGQGQHESSESRSQFELVAKSLLINEILWGIVNTFMRVGAILFTRRACSAKDLGGAFNEVTIALLVASVTYAVAVLATSLAICQPISAGWDQTVKGRCGNEVVAYLWLEIVAAVLDVAILIAPLYRVIQLKLSLRKRYS